MGLSAAERNRRKRERKKQRKKQQEEQAKLEAAKLQDQEKDNSATNDDNDDDDVEVEYVAEPVIFPEAAASSLGGGVPSGNPLVAGESNKDNEQQKQHQDMEDVLRRFQERSAVVTDDDTKQEKEQQQVERDSDDEYDYESDEEDERKTVSKRKLRELTRPSVAELKRRVKRPDLVEAHDVTASDPDFLIKLKSVPGTVPVPRHWGRKRKYLQGKRGFEKPPFQLPDFILKTGIAELRDTVMEDENSMSVKQKNRSRVAPKMGAIDVDYRTLHDAFFKYQCKPENLTKVGDLYYEGKELETQTNIKPGGPYSKALREALNMIDQSPPPWLTNMQRYGPPPSYPGMKIPGLNAPLPNEQCQYGYHPEGWGKPPVDAYGRPLYGGNPFDPPGSSSRNQVTDTTLVTSDGKTITKSDWGALPNAVYGDDEQNDESEEESSDEEMEESSDEEMEQEDAVESTTGHQLPPGGQESVIPPPPPLPTANGVPLDLRKQPGDETPLQQHQPPAKQLYQVLSQTKASDQSGAVFASDVAYVMPTATPTPEGAESVLSKALPAGETAKRKNKQEKDDDGADELSKNFKF